MSEEYTKQSRERDRRQPEPVRESGTEPRKGGVREQSCEPCCAPPCEQPCAPSCEQTCAAPCREDEWDLGGWLPVLLIILLLCSGGLFGGREDCCDGGGFWNGSSGWLIILVIIFLFCTNRENGRGGMLGGLL